MNLFNAQKYTEAHDVLSRWTEEDDNQAKTQEHPVED